MAKKSADKEKNEAEKAKHAVEVDKDSKKSTNSSFDSVDETLS